MIHSSDRQIDRQTDRQPDGRTTAYMLFALAHEKCDKFDFRYLGPAQKPTSIP